MSDFVMGLILGIGIMSLVSLVEVLWQRRNLKKLKESFAEMEALWAERVAFTEEAMAGAVEKLKAAEEAIERLMEHD